MGFYYNQPQGFYYNQQQQPGFYYNQQPQGFYYNQQPGFYYNQQQGFYYDQRDADAKAAKKVSFGEAAHAARHQVRELALQAGVVLEVGPHAAVRLEGLP